MVCAKNAYPTPRANEPFLLQPGPPSKGCMRLQIGYVWRQSIGVNTAHSLGNLREVNSKQHDHVSGGLKSV